MKVVKAAYIVAFAMAGLGVIYLLATRQIVLLPFAIIPLIAGIGILRGRVWSAYGFALFESAQVAFVPLVLLRAEGSATAVRAGAVAAVLAGVLIALFFSAGRSLAAAGAQRGWAWPWIVLSALTAIPVPFLQAFVVPTGSMENTLLIGDRVLVQRFPKPNPERGDLVVHVYPIDRHQIFLKRVIGVPGDRIRILAKIVYRNGTAITEPYAVHKTDYEDSYRDNFPSMANVRLEAPAREMLINDVVNGEVVVPAGKYFVLGDNRDSSWDSRYWGFVSSGDLIGKPLLIYDSRDQPNQATLNGRAAGLGGVRWDRLLKVL